MNGTDKMLQNLLGTFNIVHGTCQTQTEFEGPIKPTGVNLTIHGQKNIPGGENSTDQIMEVWVSSRVYRNCTMFYKGRINRGSVDGGLVEKKLQMELGSHHEPCVMNQGMWMVFWKPSGLRPGSDIYFWKYHVYIGRDKFNVLVDLTRISKGTEAKIQARSNKKLNKQGCGMEKWVHRKGLISFLVSGSGDRADDSGWFRGRWR